MIKNKPSECNDGFMELFTDKDLIDKILNEPLKCDYVLLID